MTAIVDRLPREELGKILVAFLHSPFSRYAKEVFAMNWSSSLNCEKDMFLPNGGSLVYVATGGANTFLAKKLPDGNYRVNMVTWQ